MLECYLCDGESECSLPLNQLKITTCSFGQICSVANITVNFGSGEFFIANINLVYIYFSQLSVILVLDIVFALIFLWFSIFTCLNAYTDYKILRYGGRESLEKIR